MFLKKKTMFSSSVLHSPVEKEIQSMFSKENVSWCVYVFELKSFENENNDNVDLI